MNHSTIQYYEDHAEEFAANTIDADMEEMRTSFLAHLPTGACIRMLTRYVTNSVTSLLRQLMPRGAGSAYSMRTSSRIFRSTGSFGQP